MIRFIVLKTWKVSSIWTRHEPLLAYSWMKTGADVMAWASDVSGYKLVELWGSLGTYRAVQAARVVLMRL